MKQHTLGNALVGLTALMVFVAVWLCYAYVQNIRKSRRLQSSLIVATMNRNRAQALAVDAQEFAKKNKQMESLLQSLSRMPPGGATNTPRSIAR